MIEFWDDYAKQKYGEKQMIFIKILQKMLKLDLMLQIMMDHCLKKNN